MNELYKNYTNQELLDEMKEIVKKHEISKKMLLHKLEIIQEEEEIMLSLENNYNVIVEEFKQRKLIDG